MFGGSATIVLSVRDLAASVEYYQRVLGFVLKGYWNPEQGRLSVEPPLERVPNFVELAAGDHRLRLKLAGGTPATVGAEFMLEVDDVDVVHRRAVAGEAAPTRPKSQPDGSRAFSVTDPDGYRWTLCR